MTKFVLNVKNSILKKESREKGYPKGQELNEILDVTVSNGVITLVKPFRHKTLEERSAEFDGKLILDGEYGANLLGERCGDGTAASGSSYHR